MNRIKSIGLLLSGVLIVSIMFLSVPVFAQTGILEVTCEGPSGAPEKDVRVTIMPMGANKGNNKKSDAAGVTVFDKLAGGAYRVVGRKDGFAPALYEIAVVNNNRAQVALKLTAGADRKLYFEDQALERRANTLLDEGTRVMEGGNAAEAEKIIAQSVDIMPFAPDALYYHGLAQLRQAKFDQAAESFKKSADIANSMLTILPKPKPAGMGVPGDGAAKPGGGPGGGAAKPGGPGGGAAKPGGGPGGGAAKPGGGPGGGAPKPAGPSPVERQRMVYEMLATNAAQQLSLIPVLKADTAYEAKKFDEAIALYDEAIKINPQNPGAYSNKALALTQAGRFDEALASINRALEINPGDERAVQVKKAVDTFIENAAREKENARIKQANDILNEGNKLLDTDASSALKKYEEANSLTGEKQSVIWRQVGRARAKLKQDSEAVAAFRKAIELAAAEQAEDYQMSLAQYYLDAKRPDEALDVVVAGSKNPEQRLMDLYTRGKNNPESMAFSTAALERVVKLNPSNIDAAFELGQVYYMDRKDSQAQELLTRYVENGKDAGRIQTAKDLLTVIGSRNKPKP